MNRRSFLSSLPVAACTAVARAYVPAALVSAKTQPLTIAEIQRLTDREIIERMREAMRRIEEAERNGATRLWSTRMVHVDL